MCYFKNMLKNREMLAVGTKPAPGDLAYVQGFLNLFRHLEMHREIDRLWALKRWMVRHGLGSRSLRLGKNDWAITVSLYQSLRGLLADSGGKPDRSAIAVFNHLIHMCDLQIECASNGVPRFRVGSKGYKEGVGALLTIAIESIRDGRWQRLKACTNPECQWIYHDSSKNCSGRWCDMAGCGGRFKSRAWRGRHAKRK